MTEQPNDQTEPDTTDANPADLPQYKDDTSDGTTAVKSPQELAEQNADQVKSSDDLAREAAGIEHPQEGHDINDYRPESRPFDGGTETETGEAGPLPDPAE